MGLVALKRESDEASERSGKPGAGHGVVRDAKEMSRVRLDVLLFERGFTESREKAKAVVMSGNVFVDGVRSDKPGALIKPESAIEIRGEKSYVSRGGQKLEKALSCFGVKPEGKICIDCGASTGGFTDCLLRNGAQVVYAVDVGYGQLAWNIRNDPRVVTMERTNIRFLTPDMLPQQPELAVIDVSFISLALVLPAVKKILAGNGEALCLIKPQFEAGREKVGKKGVVRDAVTHIEVLNAFIANSEHSGFSVNGLTHSPVKGPEGNIEYLGWLGLRGEVKAIGAGMPVDTGAVVRQSHIELREKASDR